MTINELQHQIEELKHECAAWRAELAQERITKEERERGREAQLQVWKSNLESIGNAFRDKLMEDAKLNRKEFHDTGEAVRKASVLFGIFGTVILGLFLTLVINGSREFVKDQVDRTTQAAAALSAQTILGAQAESERVKQTMNKECKDAELKLRGELDAAIASIDNKVGDKLNESLDITLLTSRALPVARDRLITDVKEHTLSYMFTNLLQTKQEIARTVYEQAPRRMGDLLPNDATELMRRIDTMVIYYSKKLTDPEFTPDAQLALSLLVTGISNVLHGKFQAADRLFDAAQKMAPKLPDSYVLRYLRWGMEGTYAGGGQFSIPRKKDMNNELARLAALPEAAWRDHPDARRLIAAKSMFIEPYNYPEAKQKLEIEAELFPHPRTCQFLARVAWLDPSHHDPKEALKQLDLAKAMEPSDLGIVNDLLWFATHVGIEKEVWSLNNAVEYWAGWNLAFDHALDLADQMATHPTIKGALEHRDTVDFNNVETVAEAYFVLWQDSGKVADAIIKARPDPTAQERDLKRLNIQKTTCKDNALAFTRSCLDLSDTPELKKKHAEARKRLEKMLEILLNGQQP